MHRHRRPCSPPSRSTPSNLSTLFSELSLSTNRTYTTTSIKKASIRLIPAGTLVPKSSLLELKTRSLHTPLDRADTYPQLFFSQTLNLYLARHTRGRFATVEKLPLADMREEERGARAGVRAAVEVLKEIKRAVRREGKGARLSVVWIGDGGMKVYRRTEADPALPA